MKVLLPASECTPIVKLGGLGDVVGSLPKSLTKLGVNTDVIIPFFPIAKVDNVKLLHVIDLNVPFAGENNIVEVFKTKLDQSDVDIYLLRNNNYFGSGGKFAFENKVSETEMYAFFDRAVVEYVKAEFNTYDIIHCNDWHTGLITHLLDDEIGETRPKTLFTIHNLLYQGVGDTDLVRNVGIVPGAHSLIDWDIADGDINMMQQGITSCDYISTVSPTYAAEIMTKEFGGPFYDILKARKDRLTGILNGIDYSYFKRDFDINNYKEAKKREKMQLLEKLHMEPFDGSELSPNWDKPLFCYIGRIDVYQKGLDLMYEGVKHIVKNGGQFVLLGTGNKEWEKRYTELEKTGEFSHNVRCKIMFDEALALKIYQASDFIVIPSRYEPCGLIQMIAMHYGTVPVTRDVGGLRDSIENGKTGFKFETFKLADLTEALDRAFFAYKSEEFDKMVVDTLNKDFSWEKSAIEYKILYESML